MDGAWIDMTKRKLPVPNEFIQQVFEKFPRSTDFNGQLPIEYNRLLKLITSQ